MTPSPRRLRRPPGAATLVAAIAAMAGLAWFAGDVVAQGPGSAAPPPAARSLVPSAVAAKPKTEDGPRWQKLKPAQRDTLKPLQQEWSQLDASSKLKWIELSERLPSLPVDERTRVQARMAEWAKLTPAERGQARLRFQEAKQIPPSDRRSRWDAYQALPLEEKNELAARAAAARTPNAARPRAEDPAPGLTDRSPRGGAQAKSNIVPNPAFSAPPRPIGPTVIQAAPGATTTLVTRRPTPPAHQQTGLPKIAATPEFVNKSTLLPQRGPQGAAVRPVGEPAQPRR